MTIGVNFIRNSEFFRKISFLILDREKFYILEAASMEPNITYDPEFGVVKVKAEGMLNNQIGLELAQKAIDIASKHQCSKILCDFTEMKVTASTLKIYEYPSHAIQMGVPRHLKVAVVYSIDEENHKFWETVTRNAGFLVRVFALQDEAIKWPADL